MLSKKFINSQSVSLARNLQGFRNTEKMNSSAGISRNNCSVVGKSTENSKEFETLNVTVPKPFVFHVELSRPKQLNAINREMWLEIKDCFDGLNHNPDCRAIVLSAAGKHFTAGIDLKNLANIGQNLSEIEDVARKGFFLDKEIKIYQDSITSLELCLKPIIVVVHSACIGAGVDLITAADIRYATKDSWFQIAEVNVGLAADVGTLQRLPKAVGSQSLARELCLSGRKFDSAEAFQCGLVSKVSDTKESILSEALKLAEEIASKSPVAVQATKKSLIYSLDRTNQEGLDHVRLLNAIFLQGDDLLQATVAALTKDEKPVFSKL